MKQFLFGCLMGMAVMAGPVLAATFDDYLRDQQRQQDRMELRQERFEQHQWRQAPVPFVRPPC